MTSHDPSIESLLSISSEFKTPEVLTVNDKAASMIVVPESYDKLVHEAELARTLRQIVRANSEHQNGESQPLHEAFKELKYELNPKYPDADL